MNLRKWIRAGLAALTLAALLAPAGLAAQPPKTAKGAKQPARARKAAEPKPAAGTPAAKDVLDKMSAFYEAAKTVQVNARTVMKMKVQGMNMDVNGTSAIAAERPNKFASVSQGQGMMAMAMSNTMISDGTTLTTYMPMLKRYMEKEAPEDIAGLAATGGGTGAEAFLIGILASGSGKGSLLEGMSSATYSGEEEINGVKCHKLRLKSSGAGMDSMGLGAMTMDLWVEAGAQPLVRRVKPDFGEMFSKLGEQMSGGTALTPEAKTCRENLRTIDGAKEQWALENSKEAGAKPVAADLAGYLRGGVPTCPGGKSYAINPVGKDPVCLSGLEGHDLASAGAADELAGLEGMDLGPMFEGMEMDVAFDYDDWRIDAPVPEGTFKFTPPEGAQKTDNLMGDLGLGDFGGLDMLGGIEGGDSLEGLDEPEAFGSSEDDDIAKRLEGKPAPDFKLKLAGGGEFDLAAVKGKKIVILDFWATWCGPCRKSMPSLIKVAKDYASKGVELVAVNLEENEADVLEFIKKENWDVRVALDTDYSIGEMYSAEAIPETVVIGLDGKIALVHVGASNAFEARLRELLDGLLAGK